MKRIFLRIAVPVGILLAGAAGLFVLMWTGEAPPRDARPYAGPLVEGMEAPVQTVRAVVEGQGAVGSGGEVDLVPQVGGGIVWKSAQMEPGGYFSRGDLLARIDPEDYELAVAQVEARVARAEYHLDLMRQEAEIARQEWELNQRRTDGAEGSPNPLVLQEPQLHAAKAEFEAARAGLAEARLRLGRTRLYAPFDGRVRGTRLEVGQFVTPGQPVAQLSSIERAEIVVSVPDEDLAWVEVPQGGAEAGAGPEVLVRGRYAGAAHTWEGRVVRALAELDPQSRMARLVVEVPEPYGGAAGAPLLVGMFVDVEVLGKMLDDVRVLPRSVLRPGDTIWTVGKGGVLRMRPVEVVRRLRQEVVVRVDLADGEKVVVSHLNGVTDGMKVRLAGGDAR